MKLLVLTLVGVGVLGLIIASVLALFAPKKLDALLDWIVDELNKEIDDYR